MNDDVAPADDGLRLGLAAVARLLERPASSLGELASRLGASTEEVATALRVRSIAALVVRDGHGALRAARGATSATLPRKQRLALAPRVARRSRR